MENTHSNLRKIIKKIIQESFQIEKQKQEFGIEILKKFSEHRKIKIHDISTNILTFLCSENFFKISIPNSCF